MRRRADVRRERERGSRTQRCSTELADACGADLLDVHQRSAPPPQPCSPSSARRRPGRSRRAAVARLDLSTPRRRPPPPRRGRRGAVRAPRRRDAWTTPSPLATRFAAWAGPSSACPASCYGPERSLPEVRRRACATSRPTTRARPAAAPDRRARPASVPGTCWSPTTCGWPSPTSTLARRVAAAVRGPAVRALGLAVGDRVQVSMNLDRPDDGRPGRRPTTWSRRPSAGRRRRAGRAAARGGARRACPRRRWAELDLGADRTIEARASAPPATASRPRWRSGGGGAAGGLGPLAADAAPLTLGQPAPDAELLAVGQGVLEAVLAHDAARGRPPWPRAWTRPARGRTGRGRHRGSWPRPASSGRPVRSASAWLCWPPLLVGQPAPRAGAAMACRFGCAPM